MIIFISRPVVLVMLLAFAVPVFAQAQKGVTTDFQEFDATQVVDDSLLDKMCGGFTTPDGITINIGVGKAMIIDGVLQPQNTLNLDSVNLNGHTLSMSDLQKIPANDFKDIGAALATIIQNISNNRHIENFTVVDIAVKNLPANFQQHSLESMKNFQDASASQDAQLLK
jgi:hypothetical protein